MFLGALEEGLSVTGACREAKISRQTAYHHRSLDEGFRAAWDDAIEAGTDTLEDEAHRRAYKGTEEPVYQQGELVGTVRKYSDTLTIFLLKGRRPVKYRDNAKLEVEGRLSLEQLVLEAMKPGE